MQYHGIDSTTLEWFLRHVNNGKQYTSSQDVSENYRDIICAVPQRSVLGPLLFLIYVNGLFKALNLLMEVVFADDANLFLYHKSIGTLFVSRNLELENVSLCLSQTNCL